jgi:hypothetical protein
LCQSDLYLQSMNESTTEDEVRRSSVLAAAESFSFRHTASSFFVQKTIKTLTLYTHKHRNYFFNDDEW